MDRTDEIEELQIPGQLMRIKGPKCENHRMICGDLAVSRWRRRRRRKSFQASNPCPLAHLRTFAAAPILG
ncbi:hypothetical protein R1sor_006575 [Riccia sorocarpa]|uniref:Uncharacterized protein n=1 Tax=Riccia sorocarpa TaxID=122646 RepID=A0ABD3HRF9_9MARC